MGSVARTRQFIFLSELLFRVGR